MSKWLFRYLKIKKALIRPFGLACVGIVVALAFVSGILFWGGFNWAMEATNTEKFCVSCHEMRDNILPEYQQSVHYVNASGVRASCPDCHVPKEWGDKVVRKITATAELYHKVVGSIDTEEKFQAKRMVLAKKVWAAMEANDSLECRNCHELTYIRAPKQRTAAKASHEKALIEGLTCIDCHKGIAHQLPEEFLTLQHKQFENQKVACSNCHSGMRHADGESGWY